MDTFARDGTVQYRRLIWHKSCYRYYFHLGDEKRCRRMAGGLTLRLSPTHISREFENLRDPLMLVNLQHVFRRRQPVSDAGQRAFCPFLPSYLSLFVPNRRPGIFPTSFVAQ